MSVGWSTSSAAAARGGHCAALSNCGAAGRFQLRPARKGRARHSGSRGGGEPNFYYALEGGVLAPENDYMELGEMLYRGMRLDFTYLHPEILEGKVFVDGTRWC